jgi:hypothetical protein
LHPELRKLPCEAVPQPRKKAMETLEKMQGEVARAYIQHNKKLRYLIKNEKNISTTQSSSREQAWFP